MTDRAPTAQGRPEQMTVGELIEALKEFPKKARVYQFFGDREYVALSAVHPVNGCPSLEFDNDVVVP